MIPSVDGTNFRQYERRVRLFVSHTRMAPEKRAGKLLQRLEARALASCEGIQDLETPNGVENLLDYLRTRFEPIEVFSGRLVDDIVYDFERQQGEEIRKYEPRDAVLPVIPGAGALQGVVPLHRKQSGAYSAQGGGPG